MPIQRLSRAPTGPAPQPPQNPVTRGLALGCALVFALAFVVAGLLPLAALVGLLPREAYFGEQSPVWLVSAGLGFLAVGVYLLSNLIRSLARKPRLSPRLFAVLVALTLAVPLHGWLFFGRTVEASSTGLTLPGGLTVFIPLNLPLDIWLAKAATALLALVLDVFLLSEILGLGWFMQEE